MFAGRSNDILSTAMPASRSWLREMVQDMGSATNDHQIILWANCPAMGVLSAQRTSFLLTYISNILTEFPDNSVCFLMHPNRAGQQEGGLWVIVTFVLLYIMLRCIWGSCFLNQFDNKNQNSFSFCATSGVYPYKTLDSLDYYHLQEACGEEEARR